MRSAFRNPYAPEDVPRKTSVVETVFALELDHKPLLEVIGRLAHDLGVAVLEDVVTPDLDLTVAGLVAHCGLAAEVDELPAEVTLVLRHVGIQRRRQARVVPRRRLRVVVHEVHASSGRETHLPA